MVDWWIDSSLGHISHFVLIRISCNWPFGKLRAALSKVEGVKFLRMEANAAVYAVESGIYRFRSSLTETVK